MSRRGAVSCHCVACHTITAYLQLEDMLGHPSEPDTEEIEINDADILTEEESDIFADLYDPARVLQLMAVDDEI